MEKFQGGLLGAAIGDAFGTTVEFQKRGSFEKYTEMKGEGPFKLLPGQYTDDTSMLLCSAESLIEKRGFDADDHHERFYRWYESGHLSSIGRSFDIGKQTLFNLQRYQKTNEVYGKDTGEAAGNGSLMRILPIILYSSLKFNFEEIMELVKNCSSLTHSNRVAVAACQYFAALIIGALQGAPKDRLLSPYYHPFSDSSNSIDKNDYNGWKDDNFVIKTPQIEGIIKGEYKKKSENEIKNGGYVVEALEAVLWVFYHTNTFEEGLIKIVNLGDDADTAGAIFGQLAGVYYGASSLPSRWLSSISFHPLISSFAAQLYLLALSPPFLTLHCKNNNNDDNNDNNNTDNSNSNNNNTDDNNNSNIINNNNNNNHNNNNHNNEVIDKDFEMKKYKVLKKVYEWLTTEYKKISKKLAPGPGDPRPWSGGYLTLPPFISDLNLFLSSFPSFLSSLNDEFQLSDLLIDDCNCLFGEVKRWLDRDRLLLSSAISSSSSRNALSSAILLRRVD